MQGVYTAIITPFDEYGKIDFKALSNLLNLQIKGNVTGIVVAGTTGEAATLSKDEKADLFTFVKENAKNLDVVAGTGSNSTSDSVINSEIALKCGIRKHLVVTPYYNKPTPKGLFNHYSAIAETSCEIVLYNVPGRTGLNISEQALDKIGEIPEVTAVKEATGSISRLIDYLSVVGERFDFMSGDDFTIVPFISMGGKGVISVLSNIFPKETVEMTQAALNGDFKKASAMQIWFNRLIHSLFIESSPIPVKTLMSKIGLIQDKFRSPLAEMEEDNKEKLFKIAKEYGL